MTGVFGNLGIDPFYAFLILLILQVALLVVLVLVYDKYKHLENCLLYTSPSPRD